MEFPLQVTFHGMQRSGGLEAAIERHAANLDRFARHIIACHVVMEPAERHHYQGNRYTVRVRLIVPGGELIAGHTPTRDRTHEDAYVAIRDTFEAVRRQVEDFERKRRGDVKTHVEQPEGTIEEIYPVMDYGVIVTRDGREIHFHRNSLVDADIGDLSRGTHVRFVEQPGEEGPWASTVHVASTSQVRE